jgi:chemotaxis protein methyltransferase CheR
MIDPVRELARLIEESSGFVIQESRYESLAEFAAARARATCCADLADYVVFLERHRECEEWRCLLNRITVKESYLFRGSAQMEAIRNYVLPRLADRRTDRRLRVWSAGCARGEEAATLAVILADQPELDGWSWSILATDVDETALAEARRGFFRGRAVSGVSDEVLESHFEPRGDAFELDPDLRCKITYRKLNLAAAPLVVGEGPFDLVLMRNVLIYFRPDTQRRVVAEVERLLLPDGFVFLGPSESLLHIESGLVAQDLGGSFCYRSAEYRQRADAPGEAVVTQAPKGLTADQRFSGPATVSAFSIDDAVEDRLEEALLALEADPVSTSALGAIFQLRAELPDNPVVHALEGIARERTGDLEAAVDAYRAAIYLQPEAPELNFLLARAQQRTGRFRSALRAYRAVLAGSAREVAMGTALLGRAGLPERRQLEEFSRAQARLLEDKLH